MGRALGAEEFVQAARFVRRIAVTVRADDHVQQLFLGDLARLVVAGLDHARLHAAACTAASNLSEILRPLPVCEAEMMVSDGAAAAAAAGQRPA